MLFCTANGCSNTPANFVYNGWSLCRPHYNDMPKMIEMSYFDNEGTGDYPEVTRSNQ